VVGPFVIRALACRGNAAEVFEGFQQMGDGH